MKKNVLAWLVTLCMVVAFMPATVMAETGTDGTTNDIVKVPENALVIDANGVCSGIDLTWFNEQKKDNADLKLSVTIPSSVKKIKENAFFNYKNLGNNVYLGTVIAQVDFTKATNLEEIGYAAFSSQSNLSGVIDLSNTKVTLIDGSAFRGDNIEGVILPSSLQSLGTADNGGSSFTECKKLKYVRTAGGDPKADFELPDSLKYIGRYTFRYSFAQPVNVKLPASVESIGSEPFNSGKIEQIIVERTSDFGGFDEKALYGAGMAVLKDKAAYDAKCAGMSSSYKSNLTYEIELKFKDSENQKKLNKKSIQYEKNATTGFWEVNSEYKLPKISSSVTLPAGFTAEWMLNNEKLTSNTTVSITGDSAEVLYGLNLEDPVIEYAKNGEVQDSNNMTVELTKTKEQSVGVKVSHPLLKSQQGTDDEYVYMLYSWSDVQNWSDGPRATAEPDLFGTVSKYNWTQNAEIPITQLNHARTGNGNEYRVTIYLGYKKGTDKVKFYNCGTKTILVSVTQKQEYEITYDLDGGTAQGDVSYNNQIVASGAAATAKAAPGKSGYVFKGWSDGTNIYAPGEEFTPSADITLKAQWQSAEDFAAEDNKDLNVDIAVKVNVAEGTNAEVSDESKTALEEDLRDIVEQILKGEDVAGISKEDAAKLKTLFNSCASSYDMTMTINAALQGDASEDILQQLQGEIKSGEKAQVWDLSMDLTVVAKDKESKTIEAISNVPVMELANPISIAFTTGDDFTDKSVRVLYLHDDAAKTAKSEVTDAAKGIVSIDTKDASTYIILSKAIEKEPANPGDSANPTKPSGNADQNGKNDNGAKTGDAMPIGILAVLMLAAAAGIAVCGRKLYKSR